MSETAFPIRVTLCFRDAAARDEFMGGLSDGFGENWCDLTPLGETFDTSSEFNCEPYDPNHRDWQSGQWAETTDGEWHMLMDSAKTAATVYPNGTWHTFDVRGIGGENGVEKTVEDAKRETIAALNRQAKKNWRNWHA